MNLEALQAALPCNIATKVHHEPGKGKRAGTIAYFRLAQKVQLCPCSPFHFAHKMAQAFDMK